MTEHLDYALSLHHLLDITIDRTNILLLRNEMLRGKSTDLSCQYQHNSDHEKCQRRKRNVQHKHTNGRTDNRNCTIEKLWHRLADHLSQRIGIICIHRHDIAVRMGVKIFDWKLLHLREHRITECFQHSLCDINHDSVIGIRSNNSDSIEACDTSDRMEQWCVILRLTL